MKCGQFTYVASRCLARKHFPDKRGLNERNSNIETTKLRITNNLRNRSKHIPWISSKSCIIGFFTAYVCVLYKRSTDEVGLNHT